MGLHMMLKSNLSTFTERLDCLFVDNTYLFADAFPDPQNSSATIKFSSNKKDRYLILDNNGIKVFCVLYQQSVSPPPPVSPSKAIVKLLRTVPGQLGVTGALIL